MSLEEARKRWRELIAPRIESANPHAGGYKPEESVTIDVGNH